MGAAEHIYQPDEGHEQHRPTLKIFDIAADVAGHIRDTLAPHDEWEALQEAEVMSKEPYNMYDLYTIVSEGRPIVRNDLCNAATGLQEPIVLTSELLSDLLDQAGVDHFQIIDKYGRPIRIFAGCIPDGADLIIFPDDLGDAQGQPRLKIV